MQTLTECYCTVCSIPRPSTRRHDLQTLDTLLVKLEENSWRGMFDVTEPLVSLRHLAQKSLLSYQILGFGVL